MPVPVIVLRTPLENTIVQSENQCCIAKAFQRYIQVMSTSAIVSLMAVSTWVSFDQAHPGEAAAGKWIASVSISLSR